jgi:16S rRNA (cytidine1402-2'-O)-methyltransferase
MSDNTSNLATLYIVGTPIGNLGDLTFRALETLKSVDYIACEDTRNSQVLLEHYQIKKPLLAHHSHNEKNSTQGIIKLLTEGKSVALISDSGMPAISDPGAYLINAVREAGLRIELIPGVSALTSAVTLAATKTPFIFLGYSPATGKMRRRILRKHSELDCSIIFYESPHRIKELLEDVLEVLGDRQITVARELTKIYEECQTKLASEFLADIEKIEMGELVVIIHPKLPLVEKERPKSICHF